MNRALAKKWDSRTRIFGKIEHLLSLADDDQAVVIAITEIPGWGLRWVVSPPVQEFYEKPFIEDFIREGNVEYYFDEAINIIKMRVPKMVLDKIKTAAVFSYERWANND